jgi:hypothetical protein
MGGRTTHWVTTEIPMFSVGEGRPATLLPFSFAGVIRSFPATRRLRLPLQIFVKPVDRSA